MLSIGFLLLAFLLLMSVPIYIALSGSTLLSFALVSDMPLVGVMQRLFGGIDKFALLAIPFFILGARAMESGGIARRILRLANLMVGGYRGGLALGTALACLFFGALCGSAPATVVAIGGLMYGSLCDKGYGTDFSTGLVTSTASVALLIPPSVTMILYGAITGVSVGELFVAGFGSGIILAICFMVYSWIYARKNQIPLGQRSTWREKWEAAKDSAWALGVPALIIGGIYGGIFTPTEAAAVSAVYAIFVGMFVYRELDLRELYKICLESGATTAQIFVMIAGAMAFSWLLTIERLPQGIAQTMLGLTSSKLAILFSMNVIMLIAGMFVDGSAFILILAPLFLPIATKVGVDPVHLGIITTLNAAIGMFTPPFGLNLFVAGSVTGLPFSRIVKGVLPFIFVSLVALAIVTLVPEISLWLPNLLYHK